MPTATCACGCGRPLRPDSNGRVHRYIYGHFRHPRSARTRVCAYVTEHGPVSSADVFSALAGEFAEPTIHQALCDLGAEGELHCRRGVGWAAPGVEIPPSRRNSLERVACHCGCGAKILRFDEWGRERRFVYGHQNRRRAS